LETFNFTFNNIITTLISCYLCKAALKTICIEKKCYKNPGELTWLG